MNLSLRPLVVAAPLVLAGCFDPTDPPADTGTSGTGAESGTATTPSTDPSADPTDPGTDPTADPTADPTEDPSADPTEDPTDPTTPGTTTDTDPTDPTAVDTTGGDPAPTICQGLATDLVACEMAYDGTPSYGTVGCDPANADFSLFHQDIFYVSLVAGDCFYVRFDNIGEAGPTGVSAADLALEIRSPSGAYGFFDDTIACTDPPWTGGGACPQALVTADVDGTYEIVITQAPGAGCINPTPYASWAAINGAPYSLAATPDIDEAIVDCNAL